MTATSVLAGLNEEATQLELLGNITLLLAEIADKLPRTDVWKRVVIGNEVTQTVAIASAQTLATVTTVGTVSDQTNIGGRPAQGVPMHLANAGAMHIYNNIVVS